MARSPVAIDFSMQRSRAVNAARLVNLYAERTPEGSKCPVVLYGSPGLKPFVTAGGDTVRAGVEGQGYAYVLSGTSVYRVSDDLTVERCAGDLIPSTGEAYMVNNGYQICLLTVPQTFVIEELTVTRVGDPDYPVEGASSLDYLDGYGLWTTNDTSGQWFISSLRDFSQQDALDFASAESNPDGLVRVLGSQGEAWLFGAESTEVWAHTGASPFPFERVPGGRLEKGCIAARSPVKVDNSIFWLGHDRIVYRADGYRPARVSTNAVEEVLRAGDVSDARGFTYSMGGHEFYLLTLPSLNRTFAYDASTGWWSERQSGTSLSHAKWEANCVFRAFGKTLVGGERGILYELDLDTFTDAGEPIRRAVASLPIYPEGRRAIMNAIELELETGVGLPTGQGSAPEVMMRFSDDDGMTWSNERRASIGAQGRKRVRAEWRRNGMFRSRMYEFAISDPVKVAIHGVNFEMEGLAN